MEPLPGIEAEHAGAARSAASTCCIAASPSSEVIIEKPRSAKNCARPTPALDPS